MLTPALYGILLATETCDPQRETCRQTGGPGLWLRVFLVVAVVGIVTMAWFVLRGYRDGGGPDDR